MRITRSSLRDKKILLGVTGSAAAHKAVDIARRLKENEASVTAVMTEASTRFVTPLSMQVASGGRVYTGLFEDPMAHINLPREADLLLVAPATANIIGKFASGIADDLLSACFLAFAGKTVIAPAMNWRMYEHPVVKRNIGHLKEAGVLEVEPERGSLACGEEGVGRMADIGRLLDEAAALLSGRDLEGKTVVVTAGPTREHIDPVRYLSNRSSGKMGYALASAARTRGARVTLIAGPSALTPPAGVRLIEVVSAEDMLRAVLGEISGADALIMAAAVADFSPGENAPSKLEKKEMKSTIGLKRTTDILYEVGRMKRRPFTVGFAAESGDKIERAREKLREKGADMMVFNDITAQGAGFDTDTNRVVIIDKEGEAACPLLSKDEVADLILDRVSIKIG